MSYPNPNQQQGQQPSQNFYNVQMARQGSSNSNNAANMTGSFPGQFSSPQQVFSSPQAAFASPQLSRPITPQVQQQQLQPGMIPGQMSLADLQRLQQQQQQAIIAQQQQQQQQQRMNVPNQMGLSPNMSNNIPLQSLSPQMQSALTNQQLRNAQMQQYLNNGQSSNNGRLNLPPGVVMPGGTGNGAAIPSGLSMQQLHQLQQAQQNQRMQQQQANSTMTPVQHPHPPPRSNSLGGGPSGGQSPFAVSPQMAVRNTPSPSMRVSALPQLQQQYSQQQVLGIPPQGGMNHSVPPQQQQHQQGRSPNMAPVPQAFNPALMHLPSHMGSPSGSTVPLPAQPQQSGAIAAPAPASSSSPAQPRQPLPLPVPAASAGSSAAPPMPGRQSSQASPQQQQQQQKERPPTSKAPSPKPPGPTPLPSSKAPQTPAPGGPPRSVAQNAGTPSTPSASKPNKSNAKPSAPPRQRETVYFAGIPPTGDAPQTPVAAAKDDKADKADKRDKAEKAEEEVKKTYDGVRGGMRTEISRLMYACGDVPDPDPQAVEYMEDLVVEFLGDLIRPEPPVRANPLAPHVQPPLTADTVRRRLAGNSRMRKYLERFDYMSMMSSTIAEARRVDMPTNEDLVRTVGSDFLGLNQDGQGQYPAGAASRRAAGPGASDAVPKRRGRPPKRRLEEANAAGEEGEGHGEDSPEKRRPGPRRGWKNDPEAMERHKQKKDAKRRKPMPGSAAPGVKFEV